MVYRNPFKNMVGRGKASGFVPGARVPQINTTPGARASVHIGDLDGMMGLGSSNSQFGTGIINGGMGQAGPGRVIASRSDYSGVLEARRSARLAAADPGLSTRGRMGAPGRGARPVSGGLEGRGTAAAGRRRPMSGPRGGTQRGLEGRGVRPAAGSRRVGLETRGVRPAPGTRTAPGPMYGPGRTEFVNARRARIRGNVEASRAGRTGGFRASGLEMPVHGPGRAELAAITSSIDDAARTAAGVGRRDVATAGGRGLSNLTKNKAGLAIGLGAAVVAGLAYKGRRGKGSSGGRTQMTRY